MSGFNSKIIRLIDANLNRAVEGVRVMEETARMVLDDVSLTSSLKDIRHQIVRIVRSDKTLECNLIAFRGSEHDVMRSGETRSERMRTHLTDIVQANAGRAQEAVRTIEEYSKLLSPGLSERLKDVRFRLYDMEKILVLKLRKAELTSYDRLRAFAIVERNSDDGCISDTVSRAVEAGAGIIGYRDRISPDGVFLGLAESFLETLTDTPVTTVIFDRLDCAVLLGADGVHVEWDGLPVERCRTFGGEALIVGCSLSEKTGGAFQGMKSADYFLFDMDAFYSQTESALNILLRDDGEKKPVIISGDMDEGEIERLFLNGVAGFAILCSGGFEKTIRQIRDIADAIGKLSEDTGD